MKIGSQVFNQVLEMARDAERPYEFKPFGVVKFGDGLVVLEYDPADSDNDPSCPTEFLYLKKEDKTIVSGVVGGGWTNYGAFIQFPSGKEFGMKSPDTLAGYLFAAICGLIAIK